jgi:hypothetical protein
VKGVALWFVKKNLRFLKNLKKHRRKSHVSHVRSLRRHHQQKPKRVSIYLGRELDGQSGSLL